MAEHRSRLGRHQNLAVVVGIPGGHLDGRSHLELDPDSRLVLLAPDSRLVLLGPDNRLVLLDLGSRLVLLGLGNLRIPFNTIKIHKSHD